MGPSGISACDASWWMQAVESQGTVALPLGSGFAVVMTSPVGHGAELRVGR